MTEGKLRGSLFRKESGKVSKEIRVGGQVVQRDGRAIFEIEKINGENVLLRNTSGAKQTITKKYHDLSTALETPGSPWEWPKD